MIMASIAMIIIGVNMIITMLINSYLMDLILERFKIGVKDHICSIYDIIAYNGLVKPRRNEYDKGSTSDNKERHEKI